LYTIAYFANVYLTDSRIYRLLRH